MKPKGKERKGKKGLTLICPVLARMSVPTPHLHRQMNPISSKEPEPVGIAFMGKVAMTK